MVNISYFVHIIKIFIATLASGSVMYFLLKIFDKSVWVKQLSFLSSSQAATYIPFEKFVLDTRYAGNLLILTFMVFMIGMLVYLALSFLFKTPEVGYFLGVAKRLVLNKIIPEISTREQEPVSPTTTDTQEQ